jgi:hypothetical protein
MEFNFGCEENIQTPKPPSAKVLNDEAKLWISDECADVCEWKIDGIPHPLKTKKGVISGNIIHDPQILVLQRSLLKAETKTGRIVKIWTSKDKKEETYTCIRKYMILFVNKNNSPLHKVSLQLIAKGCFQFEFDWQLCEFRSMITKVYTQKGTRMKDAWYSMCVFVPTFQSMIRGEGIKQTKACIATEYEKPTKDNWLSQCVGRRDNKFESENLSYAQYIHKLYCDTQKVM